MQNSLTDISSDCIQTVMDGLRKNNMDVQYVPHKEEAAAAVASLLKEGDTIAVADRSRWKRPACWSWYRTGATILSTAMKTDYRTGKGRTV